MSQRPLGAQISHMLKDRGVSTIFGIPGVHNQEMYRGIEEAGITHVLARHEQGAGFMADGYARATGRVGVCYVITGPGLCNIMTPMGQAYSDSVSMLVLSSCLDDVTGVQGQLHQMLDQKGAAAAVCDWSEQADNADAAYHLIDRALLDFATKRKRPKHIQVPIAQLQALAPAAPAMADWPTGPVDEPSPLRLEPLRELLRLSHKPLFIFGGGATGGHNGFDPYIPPQWVEMVMKRRAACFTTYAARGLIPDDYAYNFGAMLARPDSAKIIGEADLVIAVGTELAEVDLWRDQLGHAAKLVRIDLDPAVLADRHRADMQILGGADGHLTATLIMMQDEPVQSDWSADHIAATRKRWRAEIAAERPGILPVADALRAALPGDTMIYSDMTQFAYAAKEIWPMARPGHWHHPTGFGTLGYALPAAIGGKIGRADRPVVAIAGDYGFQYTMQELMVAVELNLSLPIIIWDNGKLGEIEDSMVRAQIAPNAVIQQNPDFVALARAFGAQTAQPDSIDEIADVMATALAADGPTIIHLRAAVLTSS